MEEMNENNTHSAPIINLGRKWLPNFSTQEAGERLEEKELNLITCMSYNVLADSYLDHVDYGEVPQEILEWEYRHKIIYQEIRHFSPDIICMQELEDEKLTEMLSYKQKDGKQILDYSSTFIYKVGKNDCVAIFWQEDKFRCLGTWSIEFSKEKTSSYLYCKPQVACFAALGVKGTNKIVVVGCTHILYNTGRGDTKLAQIDLIMQSFQKIKGYLEKTYKNSKISIILGGDFNSIARSGIYQYMANGEYDCMSQNRNDISGQSLNFPFTEEGYKLSISHLPSNPHAEVLKLPHWFHEIKNTKIFIRDLSAPQLFIEFGLKVDYKMLLSCANQEDRQLQDYYRKRGMGDMDDSDSDDVEFVGYGKNGNEEYGESEIHKPKYVLKNPSGSFKSAYSQALNALEKTLFEENKDEKYFKFLETCGIDKESIREQYKENDTIFGAFNPDFSDQEAFENYFEGTTREVALTSYFDHKCLLDYLWYQGDHIKISRVLDVPSFYDELSQFEGAPNVSIPSDHLPIMAEFCLE